MGRKNFMQGIHEREKAELKRIITQMGYPRNEDILTILDTFLASEDHMTEAQILRKLRNRGLDYDEKTVGDALDLFCRYGFAQKKEFQDREPVYEHFHLGQHHDHMICTRCGRVEEFVNPEMEELQVRIAREKGFLPLQHRMEIYGLCPGCARDQAPSRPLSQTETGERVVVVGHGGGAEMARRLNEMGVTQGVELEVMNRNAGPVLVSCRGCRLALGRGMSDKILVTTANGSRDKND